MPPIPAPEADEESVAPYGIRFPKPGSKAFKLSTRFQRIAEDVTAALQAFGLPPVVTAAIITAATQAARDAHWGTPGTAAARRTLQDQGATTIRTDKGWTEQYFAGLADGGANPGGAIIAGWYPVAGVTPMGSLKRSAAVWNLASGSVLPMTDLVSNIAQGVTLNPGAGSVTITQSGLYELGSGVIFLVNSAGARLMFINKNSATHTDNTLTAMSIPGASTANGGMQAKVIAPLVAGDVVRFFIFQNTGSSLEVRKDQDSGGTFAYARYLGPARA